MDIFTDCLAVDTHLSPDYFMLISRMVKVDSTERTNVSMYAPPVVFDRNARQVPLLVRIADLMWNAASLSGTYPGSTICIPTSSYSLSANLVRAVGGWDVGPDAMGEDIHMFLKCFFHTRGQLVVRLVMSPASQSNVASSARGFRGWADNHLARWRQGVRHMWGALDLGYSVCKGIELWQNGESIALSMTPRFAMLYLRLFEAHCVPLQLLLSIAASAIYQLFIPSVITPMPILWALRLCNVLKLLSFGILMCYFALYRRYHALCLGIRIEDRKAAGLPLDERGLNRVNGLRYWLECLVFPVAGALFGSLPALVAQMSHLFTDRLQYTVSLKPVLEIPKSGTV